MSQATVKFEVGWLPVSREIARRQVWQLLVRRANVECEVCWGGRLILSRTTTGSEVEWVFATLSIGCLTCDYMLVGNLTSVWSQAITCELSDWYLNDQTTTCELGDWRVWGRATNYLNGQAPDDRGHQLLFAFCFLLFALSSLKIPPPPHMLFLLLFQHFLDTHKEPLHAFNSQSSIPISLVK